MTTGSKKAAIVGGGVIGGGWAARFLLNGWDVAVFDPDPEAERKIGEVIANARRALPALYDRALPDEGSLTFYTDMAEAVADVDWVQESVPERLDLKHKVLGALSTMAPASAVIASSTSGFRPSELNAEGARAIVAHPFNPVYLLPLVELVGTSDRCAVAADILRGIGMYPLTVRKEIDAHIADRLLEAVWRESLWLVQDGVATGASTRNWASYGASVELAADGPEWQRKLVTDPQTSGGLLIACAPEAVEAVQAAVRAEQGEAGTIVGEMRSGPARVVVD